MKPNGYFLTAIQLRVPIFADSPVMVRLDQATRSTRTERFVRCLQASRSHGTFSEHSAVSSLIRSAIVQPTLRLRFYKVTRKSAFLKKSLRSIHVSLTKFYVVSFSRYKNTGYIIRNLF